MSCNFTKCTVVNHVTGIIGLYVTCNANYEQSNSTHTRTHTR